MTEPATTDHPVKSRATKKAAAKTQVVDNVSVTEAEAPAPAENVISAPKRETSKAPSIIQNDNGVIGSPHAERVFETVVEEPKENPNLTAVWSDKNIRWQGVGSLVKGYNIVTKEAAEKWLSRDGIREATPEEVATHYGK